VFSKVEGNKAHETRKLRAEEPPRTCRTTLTSHCLNRLQRQKKGRTFPHGQGTLLPPAFFCSVVLNAQSTSVPNVEPASPGVSIPGLPAPLCPASRTRTLREELEAERRAATASPAKVSDKGQRQVVTLQTKRGGLEEGEREEEGEGRGKNDGEGRRELSGSCRVFNTTFD
jgi:hypothetical protein